MALTETRSDMLRDCLDDLACPVVTEEMDFGAVVAGGTGSVVFRRLVAWLANSVCRLAGTHAALASAESEEDESAFVIELSSFLKEYGCPHRALLASGSLADATKRVVLLEFLCTELQACRMLFKRHGEDAMDIVADVTVGTTPSEHLTTILKALQLQPGIDDVFGAIHARVNALLGEVGGSYLSNPLLKEPLTPEQWATLTQLNAVLAEEYSVRRRMLLKRVDVTIQSFKWSERAKLLLDKIEAAGQPLRRVMTSASFVDVHDVQFATEDLLRIDKVCNPASRANVVGRVHGVLIGTVPDRGGRPGEARPPPAMPGFRKRTVGAPKPQRTPGGGGRGGGGRGRGGRRGRDKGGRGGKRG